MGGREGGMRKRERENPCGVCGHYHRYEEGEVCGVCGHRAAAAVAGGSAERAPAQQVGSAFASEILGGFLYLGSYDNASRGELLKRQGISRILNVSQALFPSLSSLWGPGFPVRSVPLISLCSVDRTREPNFRLFCFDDQNVDNWMWM